MRTTALLAALLSISLLASTGSILAWPSTNATGYGAGGGTLLGDDSCPGRYEIALELYNETATRGEWSVDVDWHAQAETILLQACGVRLGRGTLYGSFDPSTGGCFGGAPADGGKVCLAFVNADRQTSVRTYNTTFHYYGSDPGSHYHGYLRIAFVDDSVPPPPTPDPVPDWTPTDATGFGAGATTLSGDSCPAEYSIEITLFNQTASRDIWTMFFFIQGSGSTLPDTCGLLSSSGTPNGTFDPTTGGCLGQNASWEGWYVCLDPISDEPTPPFPEVPGQSYQVRLEDIRFGRTYGGTVRIIYEDLAL